jgi:hypothetical protein
MLNPVNSISNTYPADLLQQTTAVKSAAQQAQVNQPQDSVQLSQAALSATGDVDHDGDSH